MHLTKHCIYHAVGKSTILNDHDFYKCKYGGYEDIKPIYQSHSYQLYLNNIYIHILPAEHLKHCTLLFITFAIYLPSKRNYCAQRTERAYGWSNNVSFCNSPTASLQEPCTNYTEKSAYYCDWFYCHLVLQLIDIYSCIGPGNERSARNETLEYKLFQINNI